MKMKCTLHAIASTWSEGGFEFSVFRHEDMSSNGYVACDTVEVEFNVPPREVLVITGKTHAEKLSDALSTMGDRWCLHPSNRIPRGDYATQSNRHVDVAATFAKVRARINRRKVTKIKRGAEQ